MMNKERQHLAYLSEFDIRNVAAWVHLAGSAIGASNHEAAKIAVSVALLYLSTWHDALIPSTKL